MSKSPPPRRQANSSRSESSANTPSASSTQQASENPQDASDQVLPKARRRIKPRKDTVKPKNEPAEMPMHRVAFWLYCSIIAFGWTAMANAYHSEIVGRPEVIETASDAVSGFLMVLAMIWTYVKSSVVYLGSIPSVLGFTVNNALGIPIVMLIAIAATYAFARWTEKVKRELAKGFDKSEHRTIGRDERKARVRRR